MKCIVFDLDNTLCKIGKEILPTTAQMLKTLEDKGNQICICSGKPTFYLVGMFRQVGLKNPIFIGETGGVIQFGVDLPPKKYCVITDKQDTVRQLKELRADLENKFGDRVWFQPNEIEMTAFPHDIELFDQIQGVIDEKNIADAVVYRQVDCFDIVPSDVSKSKGLQYLATILGLSSDDFIAVGDGINDYPMFEYAGLSLGVDVKDKSRVTVNFKNIDQALESLIKTC